jgi:hypothetical protein
VKEAEVVAGQLVKAREATSVMLKLADEALNQMTFLVKLLVIRARLFAVRLRRDNRFGSPLRDGKENRVGVVSLITKDEPRLKAFKQGSRMRSLVSLACCENEA